MNQEREIEDGRTMMDKLPKPFTDEQIERVWTVSISASEVMEQLRAYQKVAKALTDYYGVDDVSELTSLEIRGYPSL